MQASIITVIIAGIAMGVTFYLWKKSMEAEATRNAEKSEKDLSRKMYELAILKELGDRIGYSLNIQKIIDVITGSLHQFIDYAAVSYMLLEPDKIIFKIHLERSVHRKFIDEIRDRMLRSLSALMEKELDPKMVDELLSGAILIEDMEEPVSSFFNIPLVIGSKVVGILTVADTKAGLYREEEMTILYKITQQASNAVTKLQEVVQTEQRKLNAMVESITEGVVMTDKNYQIVVANPAVRNVIGLNEKKDLSIFDFIDNLGGKFDIRGKLEESVKLDRVLESSDVLIGDKFYQIFVSPVKSSVGMSKEEILGGVVIFHDVTHDKEIEHMKEDFISMMVHELRSPLDGIKKRIEVIKESPGNVSENTEMVSDIYENASGMLEMVNDLLDSAKIEAGKFEVFKESSNIKNLIESRVRFFELSAKDADVTLVAQLSSSLPENASFDPNRIGQVLNNLFSNALKFTQKGGSVTIRSFIHSNGNSLMKEAESASIPWSFDKSFDKLDNTVDSIFISITDTGTGISPEHIKLLFNKFKQFKETATSKDKKGTGLGLAIAKGIVEMHGGIIGVESKENQGSTFYFTIPISETHIN